MRKQTKLVAVLSAAALLAMGASMTSFAAGWEKDDAGVWHYYDSDDEMVTGEWKKDGGKWFYLDDDGNMLTDSWVDDDYYVGEDGAMLTNAWKYTMTDDDQDDPDSDGEHWYYFNNKGKKVVGQDKKINGKTYLFNEDGEMLYGWQDWQGAIYYFGEENDGARTENKWLWLEKSGMLDTDEDVQKTVPGCSENDICDDEGWYWFNASGKMYKDAAKKKINGKYYMFNDHGQMLYEWINDGTVNRIGSNAQLDGKAATTSDIDEMKYYEVVEDGSRVTGWRQIDGSEDVKTDSDTDWYYFKDGKAKRADVTKDHVGDSVKDSDTKNVYRARIKVEGKYFCFNENGQMQDGLQYIEQDHAFYFYDANGYEKTGKIATVECEDDDYAFYFNTKNGKNGQGYTGEKDGYLYFGGKRLEADDDYRLFYVENKVYLVNNKGKVQKTSKKYDVENDGIAKEVYVKIGKNSKTVDGVGNTADTATALTLNDVNFATASKTENVMDNANKVSAPFIQLYDDNLYTYTKGTDASSGKTVVTKGWVEKK